MARKKQIAEARKQELTARLAAARQSLSQGKQELVGKFKVKRLLGQLVTRKPKALFAGSTAAGLILTLLIKRPKKAKKNLRLENHETNSTHLVSLPAQTGSQSLVGRPGEKTCFRAHLPTPA